MEHPDFKKTPLNTSPTEHKTIANSKDDKEANYHFIFEQATDPIFVTDFNGNFIDLNSSCSKLFGYTREELLQLNVADLIDAENLQVRPIPFGRIAEGNHIFSHRTMITKTGSIIEVEANVKKCGENTILVILQDVTEMRKARLMMEQSEARFRGAFEHAAIGMALVSLKGNWLKVNRELCNMIGYTEEELLQLTFQDITHPHDLNKDLEYLSQTLSGAIEFYRMEKRYFHKDGALIWANLTVSLVRDAHSFPLYFVSQIENITERKRSEEALMKSEANLQAVFNTTDTAYTLLDNDLNIVSFNKGAADFAENEIGIPAKQGIPLLDYVLADRRPVIEQVIPDVLKGRHITYEASYPQQDGTTHWYYVRFYPIPSRQQEVFGLVLAIDDITRRKEDELHREQIATDLINRNKDLEQFTHILSHNVRSNVARLIGLTDVLLEHEVSAVEQQELLDSIARSSRDLDKVIRDLNNILQYKN